MSRCMIRGIAAGQGIVCRGGRVKIRERVAPAEVVEQIDDVHAPPS